MDEHVWSMQMLVYSMLGRPYHSHGHSCPGIKRNIRKRCWGAGGCRKAGKGPVFPTAAQSVLIQKVEAAGENPKQHSEVTPLTLTFSDILFNLKGKVWHFGEYAYLHHTCDCWAGNFPQATQTLLYFVRLCTSPHRSIFLSWIGLGQTFPWNFFF